MPLDRKKIIVRHYCSDPDCGRLYCERPADAHRWEPGIIEYKGYKCPKHRGSVKDIAPIFLNNPAATNYYVREFQ
ncbi:MAG: hypothetical protein ACFE95_13390 [Candidatus Hodarchaeota archaeon]